MRKQGYDNDNNVHRKSGIFYYMFDITEVWSAVSKIGTAPDASCCIFRQQHVLDAWQSQGLHNRTKQHYLWHGAPKA